MAKGKQSLKETLNDPILREGLIDTIFKAIMTGKLKAKNKEIKQLLISTYGSWDKVPDWRKEYFGMK
mgnify:CR=1 FL=1|tara:strand:- start:2732 stop:2932 length:201 start_codon:yes stop_codon:yes gene_type:complete